MNKKFGILAVLWLVQFVNYIDRVNISLAGPTMMKSLSIDPHSFGFILAAFTLGYGLMQIPGGLLADRYGTRVILIAAPILWSIFTGLTGLAESLAFLIAARIGFGMAEGGGNAALFKVLADNFPSKERARASSIVATAFAIGPAVAAPLVTLLLLKVGWHAMFLWLAVPGCIVSILVYFVLTNQRGQTVVLDSLDKNDTVRWQDLVRRPTTLALLLAYFTFNIGFWGYIGWMPSYLSIERHIDIKALGVLAGIPYLFAFLGILLFGWLGSGALYRYRAYLLAGCSLCVAASLYVAYASAEITSSMVGLSAAAFFLYGSLGPYGSLLQDLAPVKGRGSFAGLVSTMGQIGGLLAPVAIGFLVRATGSFTAGFLFMIGALGVTALSYLALASYLEKDRRFDLKSTVLT